MRSVDSMRKNKTETEQTIQNLLEIARQHFIACGYANVTLEEIAKEPTFEQSS